MPALRFLIAALAAIVPASIRAAPPSGTAAVPAVPRATYRIGGAELVVSLPPEGSVRVGRADIESWVTAAARAVTAYYGRFPVARVSIEIVVRPHSDHIHGQEFDGERIRVYLGGEFKPEELARDWNLTHEMIHLAFPDMDDRYLWMEEGLSTYLEPVIRARAGMIRAEQVWSWLIEGIPKGQPGRGDLGLDRTHTWGRTYWGGALFWLLCDLELRERSGNRKSIDDVLRRILVRGGDGAAEWTVEQVLQAGKDATGLDVLREVYARLAPQPERVDPAALWKKLGVTPKGESVTFDDGAPESAIRRAITAPAG